ncbi:MAG TPA: hypothetical protein VGM04_06935 [Sphingomicrobium sp.]|jgi:hypothetical protein
MARFGKWIVAAALAGAAAVPAAAQYQQQYPQQSYPQYPQTYPEQQYPQTYPEQSYPQQGYPQYPQTYPQQGYGYPDQQYGTSQNAIGAIIDSLIGNRYDVSDRQAIHQCAYAAVQRAQGQSWGGYGQSYPAYNRYLRVTAITDVQRRSSSVRIRGELGRAGGNQGYAPGLGNQPYDPRYGYGGGGHGRAELSFRCDVDYRGYVRNVRVEPLHRAY